MWELEVGSDILNVGIESGKWKCDCEKVEMCMGELEVGNGKCECEN